MYNYYNFIYNLDTSYLINMYYRAETLLLVFKNSQTLNEQIS